MKISREKIESAVIRTLDELPDKIKSKLENVDIVIEDSHHGKNYGSGLMLGLYQGIPVSKRGFWYGNVLPDKITIFRNSIEAICKSEKDIDEVVRTVVVHELAHYFGFEEEEIRKKGY